MTEQELDNLDVEVEVDARGMACPGPLLEAKRSIGKIEIGEIMEIISSDEGTNADIPNWCEKVGHEYLGNIDDDGDFRLFVKRTK